MSERVSIIIPCYNREDLIGDAIKSALSQKAVHEVVVVDDGSTDRSWEKIQAFGSEIKAVQTANSGPSAARNTGVAQSSGDWIKFLDSDDLLVAGAVHVQLGQLTSLPTHGIPVGQLVHATSPTARDNPSGAEIDEFTMGRDALQVSRPLIPRVAFDEVGGFCPSTGSEDHELFIRMVAAGWRFFEFETAITQFRDVDPNRLTNNLQASRFLEILSVYKRLESDLFAGTASVTDELRRGVGVSAWSMARRCTRLGYREVASEFFDLATRIAGHSARTGTPFILALYHLFDPLRAENYASLLKRLVGKA